MAVSHVTSSVEGLDPEAHYISCSECFSKLLIILRLQHTPVKADEEKALALLYPIGLEAARTARQRMLSDIRKTPAQTQERRTVKAREKQIRRG
jgi:hypothetical protein